MKLLVMAAAGNQGRILLPRLREAGIEVRAVRARSDCEDELKKLGANEVMVGDACDRAFLREAVAGVDAVYYITPTAHPQEREMGWAMIDAVRESGIGHLIYSSVLHPIASPMLQHKAKRDIEERLLEANIAFTVLQPADYMMPNVIGEAIRSRVWRQLYDLDRVQAMVALEDVAEVVVKVAREHEAHFGATYQLCAPGNFSGNDIAAAIARVTGLDIGAEIITPDDYFRAFYGMGDGDAYRYPKAMIRSVAMWYGQYDFVGNPNVLTWLLGRPPTTLDQFIGKIWRDRG
ncbi:MULTISPECIES: SDR family oxidoreductase [Sphingobium]|uniref:SDR family oxidoreductase n=1 Tax=Sphingobium sp. MI1205 TaxID=407020 RepID=UPI00076FF54C|nr:NmrA family NAD(P)-binding protein [Sphingobium sp. MI1205]AMK19905.1 putative nucleoside-diphosphate-sugar epimerase [Sphingobium sp. MI1205]